MLKITPNTNPQYSMNRQKNVSQAFGMNKIIHFSEEESKKIIDSFSVSNTEINSADDVQIKEKARKNIEIDISRVKKLMRRLQENIEILKDDSIVTTKLLEYRKELQKELKSLEKRILQLK